MTIKEIQKRIQKVFDRLMTKHIICRQDFTCCSSCGCCEIDDLIGRDTKGFCFYHHQDWEDLKKNGSCYLVFSAVKSEGDITDEEHEEIGKTIVKEFKKEGIKVNWDGDTNTRIQIDFEVKK